MRLTTASRVPCTGVDGFAFSVRQPRWSFRPETSADSEAASESPELTSAPARSNARRVSSRISAMPRYASPGRPRSPGCLAAGSRALTSVRIRSPRFVRPDRGRTQLAPQRNDFSRGARPGLPASATLPAEKTRTTSSSFFSSRASRSAVAAPRRRRRSSSPGGRTARPAFAWSSFSSKRSKRSSGRARIAASTRSKSSFSRVGSMLRPFSGSRISARTRSGLPASAARRLQRRRRRPRPASLQPRQPVRRGRA